MLLKERAQNFENNKQMPDSAKKEEAMAIMAVIGNQVMWGFSPMFNQIALRHAQPEMLLAARFILAFIFMSSLILMGKV